MVRSSEGGDNEGNNFASFPSLTEEIISAKKRVTETLVRDISKILIWNVFMY